MQYWRIDGKTKHLCNKCSKDYAGIILECDSEWLGSTTDNDITCDDCCCTDRLAKTFGKSRKVVTGIYFFPKIIAKIRQLALKSTCRSPVLRKRAL